MLFGHPIKGVTEQHWRLLSEPLASDHSLAKEREEKTRHTSLFNRQEELGPKIQSVAQIHLEAARLFEKGDWFGALAKLEEVLTLEGRRPGINYLRGKCLKELGQLSQAKEALELELKDQPNHPDAQKLLRDLDRLLCSQHSLPQNDTAQQQALQLCEQGSKLWQLGNTVEALAQFDAALRLESALLGVQYARALCLERLSRIDDAEAAVRIELQIEPGHVEAKKLFHKLRAIERPTQQSATPQGAYHFARREWNLALACFDQMTETEFQQPGLHYLRAQCFFHLGRWKDCERAIFAELKVQPNHPDTRGLLRDLRQQQKPITV